MELKVGLPLRLSVSFCHWNGEEKDFLKILQSVSKLKLFNLFLEFDRETLPLYDKHSSKLSYQSFRKSLVIDFSDFQDFFHLKPLFNEIEVDIPFYAQQKDIEHFLNGNVEKDFVISFLITRDNIKIFEEILKFSISKNKKIKIPNTNLIRFQRELSEIFLRKEDLKNLEYLKPLVNNTKIEVHDYFLAKFFQLPDASKFLGCQAGKLLGHIENGILYPCASIPEPIGSLIDYDFEFLWNKTYNIIENVFKRCCTKCDKRSGCKMGCIGNAIILGNCKDPLCEE